MSALITRKHDDILVVYFRDIRIVDEPHIQSIGAELLQVAQGATVNRMLLNFHNVKFMASAMIGKIILLHKLCKQLKIDLRFCEVTENIREVFKLMKLDKLLDIQGTEADAIDSFLKYKKKWYV